MLRKVDSRLEFYFLHQILVLLLVLPLTLQLVSQQTWIERLWLAFAKPSTEHGKLKLTCRTMKKTHGIWSHKFSLYKDLQGYHSLVCLFKTSRKKAKGLEELLQIYNFPPGYPKRNWALYWENFAGTEN